MMQGSKAFCSLIRKQIADEIRAEKEYARLSKLAPTKSIKEAIDRVGSQEGKHRSKLTRMYRNHCT